MSEDGRQSSAVTENLQLSAVVSAPTSGAAADDNKRHTTNVDCIVVVTDGWLMLRSRFTKKWKKRWFVLNGVNLRYGTNETKLKAKISLDGARIREADKDAKRYAFSVEPRSGRRVYYFQAADDVSRMKWMQAMCFAKFSSHRSEEDDDVVGFARDLFRRSPCTIS